jgi:opacity protein-like surface antigen
MYNNYRAPLTWVVVVSLFILCSVDLQAQSDEHQSTLSENSLKDGSWAFQFQIADNFTLGAFQGTIISAKRHYSENSAIRLGTSLSFTTSDDDGTGTSLQADTIFDMSTRNGSGNGQSVQVMAQYLYYPNPLGLVNIFFGAGPQIQFSRSHTDVNQVRSVSGNFMATDNATRDTKSWAIGANALAGVEWFVTRSLSVHAEYGLLVQYVSAKETSSSESRIESPSNPPFLRSSSGELSRKGWQFSGTSVKFGLSVYF